MIDRLSPTRRPDGPVRGYQGWKSLLFLHWETSINDLRRIVPESLELDLYDGRAYLGVVPFAMEGVRPKWSPRTLAFNFLETNVRTYVVRDGVPGVYFLSLEAASRIAVWTARTFWGLPYYHARMTMSRDGDEVRYRTVRSGTKTELSAHYRIGEPLPPADPESIEFFFLERYFLFVERKRQVYAGQVHHVPYPAHQAEVFSVEDQLLTAAGANTLTEAPAFAHYSPGVDVEIFDLKPV